MVCIVDLASSSDFFISSSFLCVLVSSSCIESFAFCSFDKASVSRAFSPTMVSIFTSDSCALFRRASFSSSSCIIRYSLSLLGDRGVEDPAVFFGNGDLGVDEFRGGLPSPLPGLSDTIERGEYIRPDELRFCVALVPLR